MASGKLSLFSKDYFLNSLLQIPESFLICAMEYTLYCIVDKN